MGDEIRLDLHGVHDAPRPGRFAGRPLEVARCPAEVGDRHARRDGERRNDRGGLLPAGARRIIEHLLPLRDVTEGVRGGGVVARGAGVLRGQGDEQSEADAGEALLHVAGTLHAMRLACMPAARPLPQTRAEDDDRPMPGKLAILVGGGPAPGINSVIGSATIRAQLDGVDVLGIRDGFEWLMQGDVEHVQPLTIEQVSRIHFRGGSYIGISRANPTVDPQLLENTVVSLLRLKVSQLITIGGDDTAFSCLKLAEQSAGRIRVVHVPKTIDNDLDLPPAIDTFGFQTARHYGVEIVKNLMVDAKTTSRWYVCVAMGRKAGHLALGIGKAAGATLTLIPEEFEGARVKLKDVVDPLVGAIVKRLADGRRDGVAVVAEGVVLSLDPEDLAQLHDVERDAHGHVRIAEVDFGDILKRALQARL